MYDMDVCNVISCQICATENKRRTNKFIEHNNSKDGEMNKRKHKTKTQQKRYVSEMYERYGRLYLYRSRKWMFGLIDWFACVCVCEMNCWNKISRQWVAMCVWWKWIIVLTWENRGKQFERELAGRCEYQKKKSVENSPSADTKIKKWKWKLTTTKLCCNKNYIQSLCLMCCMIHICFFSFKFWKTTNSDKKLLCVINNENKRN